MPSRAVVRLLLALLTTMTLLAGCGGGGGGDGGNGGTNEPPPVVAIAVDPSVASLAPGGTRTFTATVTGTTETRVTWSATGGTITAAGVYTAPASNGTYNVRATSVADSSKTAVATVTVRTGVSRAVTITPPDAAINAGATQQFTATAIGFSNAAVRWTTTGGTVSNTGLYTAPATAGTYIVRATSVEDPSFGAEARVVVTSGFTLLPNPARLGTNETIQFVASLPGGASADVIWSATAGTISATGLYKAPGAATSATVTATLRNDPTRTVSVAVTVNTVAITVTPTSATVERGSTFDFNATVTGAAQSGVTWSASAGTINANGLYTAPATGTSATITVTSVADTTRSVTATVTLIAPLPNVTVTVTPANVQLAPGGVFDFDSAVSGSTDTGVVWTATGGTITSNGIFTAGSATGTFVIRATSAANPNRSGTVDVKIDAIPVNISPRSAIVQSGATVQFTAVVGGAGASGGVTWTTTGGTINATGLFTGGTPGTYTVTATSVTDPSKSNTATVVVTSATG